MSQSDSRSSSSEDEWEAEYRRSLDDDLSDDDDGNNVSPSPLSASPLPFEVLRSVELVSDDASIDNSAGSHVLQALDEVWARLGVSCTAWPLLLESADNTHKRQSIDDNSLQRWLEHERERDPHGTVLSSATAVVSEQWLVCQLLLLFQRLDSQPLRQTGPAPLSPHSVSPQLSVPSIVSLADALYVWSVELQRYEPRQRVCTPQLSASAVDSLAVSVAEHASLLQHIYSFVDRHCHFSSTASHCLQAFGHSLRAYLHSHDSDVWQYENGTHAAAGERLASGLSLSNYMQPHAQCVRMLYHVIQQFVSVPTAASSQAEESSRLLSVLYADYAARSLLTDSTLSALSLCLLLDTLVPYIELLDEVRTSFHAHSISNVHAPAVCLSRFEVSSIVCSGSPQRMSVKTSA